MFVHGNPVKAMPVMLQVINVLGKLHTSHSTDVQNDSCIHVNHMWFNPPSDFNTCTIHGIICYIVYSVLKKCTFVAL